MKPIYKPVQVSPQAHQRLKIAAALAGTTIKSLIEKFAQSLKV